jgi:hypothetical protein
MLSRALPMMPLRPALRLTGLFPLLVIVLAAAVATPASAQQTFTGGGAITVTSTQTTSSSSTLTISGATGSTVKSLEVVLNGVTTNGTGDFVSMQAATFLLQAPNGGPAIVLLGDTGDGIDGNDSGGAGSGLAGVDITVEDGQAAAPNGTAWQHTGSVTVEPSSYWISNVGIDPNLGTPSQWPQSDGHATLGGQFNGTPITDGSQWTLTIMNGDEVETPVSITSWELIVTYSEATATTTNLSSTNPSFVGAGVTFTATVSTPGGGQPTGTVAFTANGTGIAGCAMQGLSGAGANSSTATCTTSASLLGQGYNSIGATYTPTTGSSFGPGSTTYTQLMEVHATNPTGNQWCNNSPISMPLDGSPLAYPAFIGISGYASGTTVSNVTVQLNDVAGSSGISGEFLLVAPGSGGQNLDFMDQAFEEVSTSGVNLTFYDTAGQQPQGTQPAASGNYEPYDGNEQATDSFPPLQSPQIDALIPAVPGTINYASPRGGSTALNFEGAFNNAPANGDWSLYATTINGAGAITVSSWCITLNLNTGVATTTTVTSSQNPQTTGQSTTFTATVTTGGSSVVPRGTRTAGGEPVASGGKPVTSDGSPDTWRRTVTAPDSPETWRGAVRPSDSPVTSGGTVTFLDNNATPNGGGNTTPTLNSNGQASFSSSTLETTIDLGAVGGTEQYKDLFEGDHLITADYSGTSTDNPSSGEVWQRLDDATTFTSGSGGSINACNAGAVLNSEGNEGPFAPNPSNIFAAGIPGTVNTLTLTLNNFYTYSDSIYETEALLEGPTKAALDFYSNTGDSTTTLGGTALADGNFTFADSASSTVPSSGNYSPGTYKPTAYMNPTSPTDSFTSSSSGFYNAPSSFNYAQPHGSSTFASTFDGTNPNGTWSLFFNGTEKSSSAGAMGGWCLNFTENAVAVTADEGHIGDGTSGNFVQGEQGAQITTAITNEGAGSTGDPVGNNPLTVVDTLNSAFTYAGFSGTGWSCSAAGQTVTCTNDSSVAASSSYPTLTLNVNVSPTASGLISNRVGVSGAGVAATNSNTDMVDIEPAAVLAVTKSHVGTFTQGQTGEWQITVTNTASSGSTTYGTINVSDTLPAGYTLSSYSSTANDWSCTGTGTNAVSCSTTAAIGGGGSSTITLMVNIPAASPASVSNTALAWGGGDETHTSQGTAASGSDLNVPVVQVPATVIIDNSGGTQSAVIESAFGIPLTVTVEDAGSVTIPSYSVTFAVSTSGGQSGTFSNASGTIVVATNGSGVANAGTFTANSVVGAYTVTATAGSQSATFNLTNTNGPPANILIASGSGQSAQVRTAFANPLMATVTDLGGNAVPNASVTFSAPTGATPGALFAGASSVVVTANGSGTASSGTVTAGTYPGGPYNVTVSSGSATNNFTLTNLGASETLISSLTATAATVDVFGFGFGAPAGSLSFTDLTTSSPIAAPVTLNTANAQAALSPEATTPTGTDTLPDWTVLGDVNGDGIPDLVTSLYQTNSVTVQLGNGDGTFQAPTPILINAGFGPAEAHLVSLRGNGTLDIIVGSFNVNQIAVLLGNGNGTFQSPVFYSVGSATNTPTSLTTGDFNHDGNLDVAVTNTGDNTVSILLGDGAGNLAVTGTPINVGHDPEAIRSGDFNGDGYTDLAVANYQDGTVTTLLNNQNLTFTAGTVSVGSGIHSGPQALAITGTGGSLLLAVANYKDDTVSVMKSNGDGTFGTQAITPVGNGPDDITFADFNNDGIQDLAVSNYTDGSVDLLLGSSGGTYTLVGPFNVGTGPYSAAVADIDLDGTPDVVVSNCFSNNTGAMLGGTQIAVPYSGLTLTAGHQVQSAYTAGGSSGYVSSTSAIATAP